MTTLAERAEREYEVLVDEDYGKNRKPRIPNATDFDFLTSPDDTVPVPIHVVEIAREEHRRRGRVDRDTSKQEFAAALGIDLDDTRDPDSGHSILEVTEAVRSYFGDPEDEAYRNFRYNMMRVSSDIAFLKETTFVGTGIRGQHEQMRRFEENLQSKTSENTGEDADPWASRSAAAVSARSAAAQRMLESQYGRAHQETLRRYRERK